MNPAGREWFDIEDRVNGPDYAAPIIKTAIAALLSAFSLTESALVLAGFSRWYDGVALWFAVATSPCRYHQFLRCVITT